MKTASLHNLGCKVNSYETEAMQQELEKHGYQIVPFGQPCDVTVINTCSVTNMADKKSRQMLHRARTVSPKGILVAAGCYVESSKAWLEEWAKKENIDILIGNHQKSELMDTIREFQNKEELRAGVPEIAGVTEYEELKIYRTAEHTRAFMKIQDGCNQFCSYCIIPYTRGRIRSRRQEDVLEEAGRLAEAGYHEIVLTGIHVSSYGDGTGADLLELMKRMSDISGIERIRLSSLEPGLMKEAFVKELSGIQKICPHFHLSLQSGCEATLRRMNRKYTPEEYEETCQRLRYYFDLPALTTDVIVGFPGETEEEFLQTEEFVRRLAFYEMHVFKYSKRNGTKAAQMEHQIDEKTKTQRSKRLISLGKEMKENYQKQFLGQVKEILLEEKIQTGEKTYWVGHTREYIKAAFLESGESKLEKNTFVTGKLLKTLDVEGTFYNILLATLENIY